MVFTLFHFLDLDTNLHSSDNIILDPFAQVYKISAVASDPYDQVPIILRRFLSIQQLLVSDNIELDPFPAHSA